jgi:hypothetical protein
LSRSETQINWAYKNKKPTPSQRGFPTLHIAGRGLPLADGRLALTEDHVVNIDAGESHGHVRYHFLSILDW